MRGHPLQRARVEGLLKAHDEADDFLRVPAVARTIPAERPGEVVDNCKLLQRIGEGGVGVVWLAQQEQPLRRQVAFKILKLGMDTRLSWPASRRSGRRSP